MKPKPVKKLSQNTKCHSESRRAGKESHHSRVNQALRFAQGDSFEIGSKNSRPGVAILVVLFVIIFATVISLSFIARSDVELAFGNNMALRMQMDYLAESGLAHAKAMITNPQDADTGVAGFWEECTAFSLKDLDFYDLLETSDYYDVVVARDDSDPTDRCNYDISCLAYRLDGIEKTAQSYLNARLRLDPCIAYWAGADTEVKSTITVNGDVYCSGNLTNSGTINGDVFASGTITDSGTVVGQKNESVSTAPIEPPNFQIDDFTPQYYIDSVAYTPQIVDANSALSGNHTGVIFCNGNLTLAGVLIEEGTLIVNGDLTVQGANNSISPVKNFPALVVNGRLSVANGQLSVTGLAQTNTMSVSAAAANVTISGALFVRDSGISVEAGYAGDITITAAPMMASTKISPDGSTTVRWTPIGGAFFKWIKRE